MDAQSTIDSVSKVRAYVAATEPFWGSLILKAQMTVTEQVQTAATNGNDYFINPTFWSSLTKSERIFLMAHEVLHKANLHHTRRGDRDPKLWNMAADYVVNDILIQAELGSMPKGGLHDLRFRGMTAEAIYTKLKQEQEQEPEGGQGEYKPGSGEPWDFGGVDDLPLPGENEQAEKEQAEIEAKTDLQEAAQLAKMAGKLPAGMERVIEEICEPTINWQAELQDFFTSKAPNDYSFLKRNRRYAGNVIMPGIDGISLGSIVFAVDTSGSVSKKDLEQFASEIIAVYDDLEPEYLHVVWADSRVANAETFEGGDSLAPSDLHPKGGGGTRYSPVFEWAAENTDDVVALVYLTDGYCGDFGNDPGYPVLWALTEKNKNFQPPFGETIYCKMD